MSTQPYIQPGEPLNDFLRSFWQRQVDAAEQETPDYRHPPLPLARIKKVMKSDPDVKMIAADAPILFCKACEIFIAEITARAFIVADSNKRRTLSRSDIAKAIIKSDQFDFLIDIVPREDMPMSNPSVSAQNGGHVGNAVAGSSRKIGSSAKRDQVSTPTGAEGQHSGGMELELNGVDGAVRSESEVLEQLESLLGNSGPPQHGQLS